MTNKPAIENFCKKFLHFWRRRKFLRHFKNTGQKMQYKNDDLLNEVLPLIENGRDPTKITANVLNKKSDGSVIVQLTPRKI